MPNPAMWIMDGVLRAVVGAGVDHHPVGDVGRHRVENLVDDVGFVLDDHVQANLRTLAVMLQPPPKYLPHRLAPTHCWQASGNSSLGVDGA